MVADDNLDLLKRLAQRLDDGGDLRPFFPERHALIFGERRKRVRIRDVSDRDALGRDGAFACAQLSQERFLVEGRVDIGHHAHALVAVPLLLGFRRAAVAVTHHADGGLPAGPGCLEIRERLDDISPLRLGGIGSLRLLPLQVTGTAAPSRLAGGERPPRNLGPAIGARLRVRRQLRQVVAPATAIALKAAADASTASHLVRFADGA